MGVPLTLVSAAILTCCLSSLHPTVPTSDSAEQTALTHTMQAASSQPSSTVQPSRTVQPSNTATLEETARPRANGQPLPQSMAGGDSQSMLSAELDSSAGARTPEDNGVSSEPIRLPELDGVVHALSVQDGVALVGGEFSQCRNPHETTWKKCQNLALVDVVTGQLVPEFGATTDGPVRDVAFSPDLRSVYVAGDFQRVNNKESRHIARVSLATGITELEFTARTDAPVSALDVDGTNVVVGGAFKRANDQPRRGLAMFSTQSGELRDWQAPVDGIVDDVVLHNNTRSVIVAGDLRGVAGQPSAGIVKLDARSGRRQYFAFEETLRKRGIKTRIAHIADHGNDLVLSAAPQSQAFQGSAKVSLVRGEIIWVNDCQNAVADLAVDAERVVFAGIRRACPAVLDTPHGAVVHTPVWGVSSKRSPYQRANSFGVFEGALASEPLHWRPLMRKREGEAATMGASAVASTASGVVAIGSATDDQNRTASAMYLYPRLRTRAIGRAGFDRSVSLDPVFAVQGGAVVAAVRGLFDSDSTIIRYDLMRDGTNVASAVSVDNSWWSRANPVLIDPKPPVGNLAYRVVATTRDGQRLETKPEAVQVTSPRGECSQIRAKRTSSVWIAQSPETGVVADCLRGALAQTYGVSYAAEPHRWVFTDAEHGSLVAQESAVLPASYAFSITFKTSRSGVVLMSHGSRRLGPSAVVDAALILDGQGRLAALDGDRRGLVRSKSTWNDNRWHRAVVVVDKKRLRIWVDGVAQVDVIRKPKRERKGRGYWRVGGDRVVGVVPEWPPTSAVGEVHDFGFWTGLFDNSRLAELSARPKL